MKWYGWQIHTYELCELKCEVVTPLVSEVKTSIACSILIFILPANWQRQLMFYLFQTFRSTGGLKFPPPTTSGFPCVFRWFFYASTLFLLRAVNPSINCKFPYLLFVVTSILFRFCGLQAMKALPFTYIGKRTSTWLLGSLIQLPLLLIFNYFYWLML